MRFIPVIDLLNGQAVHAVRGERTRYRPVKSVLCSTADPLEIGRSIRDRLGLREVYVADLNAIQGFDDSGHRDVIAALARREQLDVILDAGISDIRSAQKWLAHGVRKVVVGSETLPDLNALRDIPASLGRDNLTFSLDFRADNIISRCPHLAAMDPLAALEHIQQAGWNEVILLDLSRVGSAEGADGALASKAHTRFPDLELLIGGGIATPKELDGLKSAGIAGVLVATALHTGMMDAPFISRLMEA